MRFVRGVAIACAVLSTLLLSVRNAPCVDLSGKASTVIEWYDTAEEDTAIPFYQYLRLRVTDIAETDWTFRGYGRLAEDLADKDDVDSRLYYAYFEKINLLDNLDLKFGRQFVSTTAGASVLDGLQLRYRDLELLTFEFFGGGDVRYHENYSADDWIVGGEANGIFFDSLDVGLSYLQKWDDGDLSHELFGLDIDYRYEDILQLYNETQYDYLNDGISYFLLGGAYHRSEIWTLRAEYLFSLPIFSATSIYSVFAVSEYQEASAELTYRLQDGWRTFGRYTREIYEEVADADVVEVGIEKIRTEQLSGYLTGVIRNDGDGQDLRGVKLRIACQCSDRWRSGVGMHLDVMERRLEDDGNTDDETTSERYWVDATYRLRDDIDIQGKVEYITSDLWDEYYRGRLRLNIRF